ncbi:MAG TPA: radical SAM protein [Acidimicrobiales bacterium]|nr:radical SAM protein [Acidimicrobiales bacterium]
MTASTKLRWALAGADDNPRLFDVDGLVDRHVGTGAFAGLEFLHVNARTIINEVPQASRLGFRFTVNAYRGCSHACAYCFARPSHAYLGLGIAEDFDRRIVVKVNAVECLRSELRSRRWQGDHIAMGTNTDPYQRAEGRYHLTRGIIEVLSQHRNPFSIVTKSTLVLRDLDLLVEAAKRTEVRLHLSVGTLDRSVWRLTEPGTPPPDKRLAAVRRLNDAGVPCGVLIAPILPGLSDADAQVRELAEACAAAGAASVTVVPLHLRAGVREHFLAFLRRERPDLVALYEERFARGAYQPASEQRRLSALVAARLPSPAARRRAPVQRAGGDERTGPCAGAHGPGARS